MADTMNIEQLLKDRGFDTPEAVERGRQLLVEAGLTRPGKERIAAYKLDQVGGALAAVDLACDDTRCQSLARQHGGGKELVLVSPASCSICSGSGSQRAVAAMLEALRGTGVSKLLILGGIPVQHRELAQLLRGSGVDVRCVDGSSGAHNTATARGNVEWADLTIIWASTPLAHKVSQSYTEPEQRSRCPQITVPRRSIGALCDAVAAFVHHRRR